MSSARAHSVTTDVTPADVAELESSDLALEVAVIWGARSVLHVEHLSPPRSFWVGEEVQLEGESCDFLIGRECLGVDRLPIALQTPAGIQVVVPHGATCVVDCAGRRVPLEQLVLEDRLAPCPALAHAVQFALPRGATACVEHKGFRFVLKWTQAARPIAREAALEPALKSNTWTFASIGVHLAMLLLFYMMPPRSAALSYDADADQERRVRFEMLALEKEIEEPKWVEPGPQDTASAAPAEAAPSQPQRKPKPGDTHRADDAGPAPPLRGNPEDPANAGIIQVLRSQLGIFRAPTSPYDAGNAQAGTPDGALAGVLNGLDGSIGGGIAMIGIGRPGGMSPEGTVGVGRLDTRSGSGIGPGSQSTGLRDRQPKYPSKLRPGPVDVRGSLSKEVISRVIHRHLAEVRFCYEQQLIAHPDLQGRAAVKFIIAPDGSVKTAAMANSDLGSAAAEQCVVQAVQRWSFPAPEGGGIVIVTYPFMFAQTGN